MATPLFGALITHESSPAPFQPVIHRDQITSVPPTEYELDELKWGARLNGPNDHYFDKQLRSASTSIPQTPAELESSRPPTPKRDQAVDALTIQSIWNPKKNKWRLASAGLMFLTMGLNDAATGALIPYLEKEYHIGYAVVSLIFVSNALGFISMAPLSQMIEGYTGRSWSYVVATLLMSLGYIALVCTPPFPVVVLSFYFIGLGMALFLAMTNVFIVNLLNGTVILGFMHGLYGIGGVVSPLLATAMVSRGMQWSRFYFIPLSITLASILFMGWAYKGFENDAATQLLTSLERTASRQATAVGEPTKLHILKKALGQKTTILGAIFIFFYQGAEVAISGWVISYLISYRQGNPAQVGNVTSGFWGGITVGRFVLTHFAHKLGEKRAVFGLTAGAAIFQLLVWLVPNIIGNAVAESIVGLFLGPVYPCATAVFSKLLPRNIQISALSIVTSMGSSGGALVPFITGLLAQKLGTVVLHPIVLIAFASMTVMWALLPRIGKRME